MKNYTTEEVLELIESGKPVVIDFWAPWCGPCKAFSPTFESTSEDESFKDKVSFVKVNVDENSDLSVKYSIRNIPTILLFNGGQQVDKNVGAMSKSDFQSFLQNKITEN